MEKIFLGNIPNAFTETDIAQWIESFGFEVHVVEIIRDHATGAPRGFGFATLKEERSSQAIQQMNGERLGGRVITVSSATPLASRASERRAG